MTSHKKRVLLLWAIPIIIFGAYWLNPKRESLNVLTAKAQSQVRDRDYNQAIKTYLKIIEAYPNTEQESQILLSIGELYQTALNVPDKAIKAYDLIITRYPKSVEARKASVLLGDLYYDTGEFEKSLLKYQALVDLFPNLSERVDYQYKVAIATLRLKRYEPARRLLMRLYETNADGVLADKIFFQIGLSFFLEGNSRLGLETFTTFISRHPQSNLMIEAQFYLAACMQEEGKLEEAIVLLKKIRETYPNPQIIDEQIKNLTGKLKTSVVVQKDAIERSLKELDKKLRIKLPVKDVDNNSEEFYLFEPRKR